MKVNMKCAVSVMLIFVMVFALAGCGFKHNDITEEMLDNMTKDEFERRFEEAAEAWDATNDEEVGSDDKLELDKNRPANTHEMGRKDDSITKMDGYEICTVNGTDAYPIVLQIPVPVEIKTEDSRVWFWASDRHYENIALDLLGPDVMPENFSRAERLGFWIGRGSHVKVLGEWGGGDPQAVQIFYWSDDSDTGDTLLATYGNLYLYMDQSEYCMSAYDLTAPEPWALFKQLNPKLNCVDVVSVSGDANRDVAVTMTFQVPDGFEGDIEVNWHVALNSAVKYTFLLTSDNGYTVINHIPSGQYKLGQSKVLYGKDAEWPSKSHSLRFDDMGPYVLSSGEMTVTGFLDVNSGN